MKGDDVENRRRMKRDVDEWNAIEVQHRNMIFIFLYFVFYLIFNFKWVTYEFFDDSMTHH
jgi:hypothetical protein